MFKFAKLLPNYQSYQILVPPSYVARLAMALQNFIKDYQSLQCLDAVALAQAVPCL
ncbi:hypothetical protein [Moorena sp. SIO4G3]|uniref:hypothetical protein n=1 Tax=Moorena sp. SIO4G3 TaxID=2607821 RepID=UPI00142C00AF|nr:hypothetical protein [Moorena sp. SIO4G3]NEO76239.1 hypothetical protein [Moorena sp. SIO4G3]